MNYKEAMNYIKDTAKFGSNLGLERTEKLLEFLGNPHKYIKCIHIAGTNGKGSTTSMITQILIEANYKVGTYISPYLEEFEERMQINNNSISKEDLTNLVEKVSKAVDKVIELGYEHPTEFEIITCVMFLYFYINKVDFAVIEVGLGGRLDSTNVLQSFNDKTQGGVILSVITSIGYDHMKILGNSLKDIAYEKAGIIKKSVPVVSYPQEVEILEVLNKVSKSKYSEFIEVSKNCARYVGTKKLNNKYIQQIQVNTYKSSYDIDLSLLGKYQVLNCATAIFAIEKLVELGLNINNKTIINALKNVKWPGRLEVMNTQPLVVIDGAHNIDGMLSLKESIDLYFKYDKLVLIIGILADKEVENMISIITPMADKVIAVTPNSDRAEISSELNKLIKKFNINSESEEDYENAYKKALSYCSEKDLLLICGSLYMVGDMRKIIRQMID
ncbi:folylpolyglutamate synthase [Clostridium acetireducens DSM 10703]|jgi:dihydrofolate synthase/folylpolyglutamate synthase|uniref:tetrahydrofolate synthase n=1 Tax=Clostridium acetireducens DSM 10703 TaxID=1121290 RepID=A0A1E8EZH8_9CLOT|nr:folylpolyglutamate synthase/dihydrofolate synthase family protein [Clostridium acetireducens]OFI06116.1 folylpolyglutamate synthase [Clostridium acetireducens DSM 10703]